MGPDMRGPPGFVLSFTCQDRAGIVAAVASTLAEAGGFIIESQQHADLEAGRFFMRVVFTSAAAERPLDGAEVRTALAPMAERFCLDWLLADLSVRPRVMIAVSQTSHCLNDLLYRWSSGTLPVDPVAVVSNHETLRGMSEAYGVPFHHLPVDAASRAAQEDRILALMGHTGAEMLVLARYMQVLSPALVRALAGRCINIHHGFLPSFKGARPYHQAHARGVKLIGATAHFVTTDLDEGPIIEQAVERVDHRASVDELIARGRDIEAQVLARAVRWMAERRVILNGQKTVVFS
jgi:formyltetrahydrofolate deformylase